jgi:hypothetical protein
MRSWFFCRTVAFLFLWSCTAAGAATAFLGSVPVQYVKSDRELVVDMHRFFQPDDKSSIITVGFHQTKNPKKVRDPSSYRWKIGSELPA